MSQRLRAERLVYKKPAPLEGSTAASPDEMRKAMRGEIRRLSELHDDGADLIAVQGQVSSMKTWFLTATAEEFFDRAHRVVALAPQRVNRRSIVERLSKFGVPHIEHPSRLDLCVWEPWLETVGRVDERTCSSNGCPLYPDDRDLEELAEQVLGIHMQDTGGTIELDVSTVKSLAERLDASVCPHYLLSAMAEIASERDAVRVATYAKAFRGADAGNQLASDVALLDENHTVTADTAQLRTNVDLLSIVTAMNNVCDLLNNTTDERAYQVAHNLRPVEEALEAFEKSSRERPVDPEELFAENSITAGRVFESLHQAEDVIMDKLARRVRSERRDNIERLDGASRHLQKLNKFFSRVKAHNNGEFEFVHTRYEARGELVNDIAFQRVSERNAACELNEVYRAWETEGTHPAISRRWGNLLDYHIKEVWSGRVVVPGGDRDEPVPPPSPLANLCSITDAGTVIGYSATHNEVSDPARSADEPRPTAHRLVTAPLQLRSDGDDRTDYHGKMAVDAATPWFRELVKRAQERTEAKIAAVPINSSNAEKWKKMPVEELELPDGRGGSRRQPGIVPHSMAAIGDKGLEELPIDAVLCGVQVQGPADTARRLIELWELLVPDYDDPVEVLETGWGLLAQHAISGTIQAAGRFRTSAMNIVFERSELIELAGFQHERLNPSMEGFAGKFAQLFRETESEYERSVDVIRAARIVGRLEKNASKAPTRAQYTSTFKEAYNSTDEAATLAVKRAIGAGKVDYVNGTLRLGRQA